MAEYCHPLCAAYNGVSPDLKSAPAFAGEGAAVLGRTTLGTGAWLGAWSVIRADGHVVTIGDDFHLGVHGTVHIAHEEYPTHIGDRVTVGNGAVVHACTVGDGCVIEREAVILDGATIRAGAVISAGSVVFPRSELEGGWLYAGSPAKPVAQVSGTELPGHHQKIRTGEEIAPQGAAKPHSEPGCFVAPTARVTGLVEAGEGVGIWYGCKLDAGEHRITIGAGSNVQDNSIITCNAAPVTIGSDVTIGHNVTLTDCVVEPGSLVGIGAIIAPGSTVESDVLVAAGAQSERGQRLTSGHVWAGRPARVIGPMDDLKRMIMRATLPHYRDYAQHFRATPHQPLTQRED